MDKRQEYPTPPVGHKPSSYDLPSVIVIYTLVIVLGIGLCFCLRKANRLVPNRYSFPLVLRSNNDIGGSNTRGRGRRQRQQDPFDDIDDEESRQGLLNDFSDQDDSDEELHANTQQSDSLAIHTHTTTTTTTTTATMDSKYHSDNEEEDGFGDIQEAVPHASGATKAGNQPNLFVVVGNDKDDYGDDSNKPDSGGGGGGGSVSSHLHDSGKKSE